MAAGTDANLEGAVLFAADDTRGLAAENAAVAEPVAFGDILDAVTRLMHSHITAFAKHNLIVVQALAAETNAANCIVTF